MKEKINAVYETLQKLNIQPTRDNMSKLLGCLNVLQEVFEEIKEMEDRSHERPKDCTG